MPKRNIVWIAIAAVLAALLWKVPETLIRRDTLYSQFGPLLDVRVQVLKHYVAPVEDDLLLRGAIDGMLSRLDPYSTYFSADEYEEFNKRTEGQFSGIGISVDQIEIQDRRQIVVVSPIEGSPAFRAGIRAGDRITKVNGQDAIDMSLQTAVDLISGPEGTTVTLTLYRPSTDEQMDKTIRRELIQVPTVRGWARTADWQWDYLIDPDGRIGYVRILAFERTTSEQLDAVVRQLLAKHKIAGLVIDVRDNPGGLLDVVVDIVNGFLSEGTIVSTRGQQTTARVYAATRENTYPDIALAVLVNHGSASASEILSGALRDHKRALLVGEQTFGKGSVQEMFAVENDDGVIKLTTAYYYLPNDERIHGLGVEPNIIVELTADDRAAMHESTLAVYAAGLLPSGTQPAATTSAPAGERVEIMIDPQLEAAINAVKEQLAVPAAP